MKIAVSNLLHLSFNRGGEKWIINVTSYLSKNMMLKP